MKIYLANPRGFCAGVDRAIEIVDRALEMFGAPVFVRHEVVHNKYVVDNLKDKGAVFVDEVSEIPDNSIVIFSAHGVSKRVREEADQRKLQVFDATCPLVTKVHMEVVKNRNTNKECILIGHHGHPEVEGTMGQVSDGMYLVETVEDVQELVVKDVNNLTFVTQTTLSVDDCNEVIDALKKKFPSIEGPKKDDICYATQNRQDAVKQLSEYCDIVFVVGSVNSSNSNRLRELAQKRGVDAYLIDGASNIDKAWLTGKTSIGITAGASAPEILVQEVINQLKEWGGQDVENLVNVEENVSFSLPVTLRKKEPVA